MSNEELANCVNEELYWDPQIGGESITVEADDGVVVRRGKVGSLRQKRAAKKTAARVRHHRQDRGDRSEHDEAIEAAWAVSGVRDVEDRIRVKPPSTTED